MAKRTILAALGITVLLAACQPTPTSTITATTPRNPECGSVTYIEGKVTPPTGTPRVVLQRTVDGKWVDWQWFTDYDDETRTRLVAVPNAVTGFYRLAFLAPKWEGETVHVRVRSDDKTSFSPGRYLTTYRIPSEDVCY